MEYLGHTVNFKTHRKTHKIKKKVQTPREEWIIFENTHPEIITQHDFDLVQTLRQNRRRMQKCEELNPFSGMVYCADCEAKYEYIKELTPELMHGLIDHIEIHAPDKSIGHRQQKVDIYFRFKIAAASAIISRKGYVK